MLYKSEMVDTAISALEKKMRREGKHLLKTESIVSFVKGHLIDLSDDMQEREELLGIGIKQVVQSRLYARGYFSIMTGYFVNLVECENLAYLKMIIDGKDDVLNAKTKARNRIKELKNLSGQITLVPDSENNLVLTEYKPLEELMEDIEADAV